MAITASSNLTVTTISLTMAELGPLNPLPVVAAELDQPYTVGEGVPEELQTSARYGVVPNVYPYLMQDGYSRDAAPKELPAVVLENSKLKVTVVPSLGGRIWELFDKATGKQLLHTHDAPATGQHCAAQGVVCGWAGMEYRYPWPFAHQLRSAAHGNRSHPPGRQTHPAHVGVRAAEGSGVPGGHLVACGLGRPLRRRQAAEPERSRCPHVLVEQRSHPGDGRTRVIAPADEAFGSDYATDITRVRPTDHEGYDGTWLVNSPHAADFFFDIDPSERRWVVAADDDGDGLAMLSTGLLRGKKLFVWGQGQGGKRWQEWLSPPEPDRTPRSRPASHRRSSNTW